jgi:hypothetical protein
LSALAEEEELESDHAGFLPLPAGSQLLRTSGFQSRSQPPMKAVSSQPPVKGSCRSSEPPLKPSYSSQPPVKRGSQAPAKGLPQPPAKSTTYRSQPPVKGSSQAVFHANSQPPVKQPSSHPPVQRSSQSVIQPRSWPPVKVSSASSVEGSGSFSSQPPVKGSSQPPVNQPRSQPDRSGFPPFNAGPPAVEPRSQPVRVEPQSRSEEENMIGSRKEKSGSQEEKNIVRCPFDKLDALLSRVEEEEPESEEDEPGPDRYLPGPEDDTKEEQGPPPVFQCYGPLEFVVAPEIPATVKRYRIEETTASPDHSQYSGMAFNFL